MRPDRVVAGICPEALTAGGGGLTLRFVEIRNHDMDLADLNYHLSKTFPQQRLVGRFA